MPQAKFRDKGWSWSESDSCSPWRACTLSASSLTSHVNSKLWPGNTLREQANRKRQHQACWGKVVVLNFLQRCSPRHGLQLCFPSASWWTTSGLSTIGNLPCCASQLGSMEHAGSCTTRSSLNNHVLNNITLPCCLCVIGNINAEFAVGRIHKSQIHYR